MKSSNVKIDSWWPKSPKPGNMGDIITPIIVKKLFNVDLKWADYRNNKRRLLLSTGSIINKADAANRIVWGSGAMRLSDEKKICNLAKFLAVRGPITLEMLHSIGIPNCDTIALGDPGLLVSKFLTPHSVKKYEYGIIPHYVDYEQVKNAYRRFNNIKVINVLHSNPLVPIKEITLCKKTISSSLHGIIFSNAYEIPSSWVKFSDKLKGDDTKFLDYGKYCDVNATAIEAEFIKPDEFDRLPKIDLSNSKYHNPEKLINSFVKWMDKNEK